MWAQVNITLCAVYDYNLESTVLCSTRALQGLRNLRNPCVLCWVFPKPSPRVQGATVAPPNKPPKGTRSLQRGDFKRRDSQMTGSGANTVRSCLCHLPGVGPSASHLTSLHLSFPICNMGQYLQQCQRQGAYPAMCLAHRKCSRMSNMCIFIVHTMCIGFECTCVCINSFYEHINT